MKEELITFTTAKLAKEKGFDIPCGQFYDKVDSDCDLLNELVDGIALQQKRSFGMYEIIIEDYNNLYDLKGLPLDLPNCMSAPTQSSLQRWLREKHGWNIEIKTPDGKHGVWLYEIHKIHGIGDYSKLDHAFTTYEEALEAGLLEVLKLLKIKNYETTSTVQAEDKKENKTPCKFRIPHYPPGEADYL